ncbi:hypothetical protein [Helicoverpa armigera NPV NNg1]|uniref:Uncharacterized protein n=2 Tax=Helicoverpa armigera nucleopolyhedrovirus TaxID=51313 RepID=A0A0E3JAV7_9ABAC|nr:hypothetical protein ORF-110 [Helicoverpa armigera nucleopolyhedrovirus]AJP07399.1 hypothetical protein ORF-110 [Helicoverpa armigera nucleopolyhedrovirus]AJP07534.1 hypothetical protein ORF-110 [Helicoverpa armigera nucleopolyhedrovirus]AJP07670.1 hypothetical protein ORF-111 [Helicoverpa armigera nucleopolyhedrovirus]BAG74680.1 hypothetical protein [Helicoverpa armigera NPV NNg1]
MSDSNENLIAEAQYLAQRFEQAGHLCKAIQCYRLGIHFAQQDSSIDSNVINLFLEQIQRINTMKENKKLCLNKYVLLY